MNEQKNALTLAGILLTGLGLALVTLPSGLALGTTVAAVGVLLTVLTLVAARRTPRHCRAVSEAALSPVTHGGTSETRHEPPLELPYYRAPFIPAITRFFVKYATFSGRASRAEYWWWQLVAFAIPLGIHAIQGLLTGDWEVRPSDWRESTPTTADIVTGILGLGTLIPTLAITWRRLHDTDRSGGWFFIGLIPLVGSIALLIFTVLPPEPTGHRFDTAR